MGSAFLLEQVEQDKKVLPAVTGGVTGLEKIQKLQTLVCGSAQFLGKFRVGRFDAPSMAFGLFADAYCFFAHANSIPHGIPIVNR